MTYEIDDMKLLVQILVDLPPNSAFIISLLQSILFILVTDLRSHFVYLCFNELMYYYIMLYMYIILHVPHSTSV